MPRCKVVATVLPALALALALAGCADSADNSNPSRVAGRQQKLVDAYHDGERARDSMSTVGFTPTESECKAHYAATEGNELGSDAMVALGRKYFVAGCMS